MDIKSDVNARKFCSTLDSHGLTPNVNSATHKGGHTLDLVISRDSRPIIVGAPLFDHCPCSN